MNKTIILIGPMCAGKSSVAKKLSDITGLPWCEMDDVRFEYYKEIGFTREKEKEVFQKNGLKGVLNYWKPFEAHSVKRILEDYPNHIIAFGGGHSVYENEELFDKVYNILKNYKHIFLLLPSKNNEISLETLNKRLSKLTDNKDAFELNEYLINHESNEKLAKHIIYTQNKTIEEVAKEVISISNIT
jgi:shikimate kinase